MNVTEWAMEIFKWCRIRFCQNLWSSLNVALKSNRLHIWDCALCVVLHLVEELNYNFSGTQFVWSVVFIWNWHQSFFCCSCMLMYSCVKKHNDNLSGGISLCSFLHAWSFAFSLRCTTPCPSFGTSELLTRRIGLVQSAIVCRYHTTAFHVSGIFCVMEIGTVLCVGCSPLLIFHSSAYGHVKKCRIWYSSWLLVDKYACTLCTDRDRCCCYLWCKQCVLFWTHKLIDWRMFKSWIQCMCNLDGQASFLFMNFLSLTQPFGLSSWARNGVLMPIFLVGCLVSMFSLIHGLSNLATERWFWWSAKEKCRQMFRRCSILLRLCLCILSSFEHWQTLSDVDFGCANNQVHVHCGTCLILGICSSLFAGYKRTGLSTCVQLVFRLCVIRFCLYKVSTSFVVGSGPVEVFH